jgi:hypothetical protein
MHNVLNKFELNQERRNKILNFLADGEYWTTAENVKLLLEVNQITYARRLLNSMCNDGIISKKNISFGGKLSQNFYLITQDGIDFLGCDERLKDTKLSYQTAHHNENVQRLKIIAFTLCCERWQSEIQLKRECNFASYPDSLLTINNIKISIELQRNIYNRASFEKKISKILRDIYNQNFDKVLYICCDNLKSSELKNLFGTINSVKNSRFEDVILQSKTRERFNFIDFENFGEYLKNENNL